MAATEKLLHASSVLYTDRRNFYVDPQVTKELWTDVAPFTTMISNQEMRNVPDPVFKMFEHRNPWVKQEFLAAESATLDDNDAGDAMEVDTPVNLSSSPDSSWIGLVCEIWDSTKTTNRGTAIITAIPEANHITVKAVAGAISVSNNDYFMVVGNARGEGSSAPEAWSDELQVVYNSTQIFKTPLQVTGTLEAAVLRGESSELARLRRLKAQEHKMQKEKAFLFGKRFGGTGLQEAAYDAGMQNQEADAAMAE